MKVYIVKTSSGSYEDYYETIKKVFLSDEKAKAFKNKYNKDLTKKKKQADKCLRCEDRVESGLPRYKCYKKLNDEELCANYESYVFTNEMWNAKIEEYEVEE